MKNIINSTLASQLSRTKQKKLMAVTITYRKKKSNGKMVSSVITK